MLENVTVLLLSWFVVIMILILVRSGVVLLIVLLVRLALMVTALEHEIDYFGMGCADDREYVDGERK